MLLIERRTLIKPVRKKNRVALSKGEELKAIFPKGRAGFQIPGERGGEKAAPTLKAAERKFRVEG